jgi:hypothetical protein
MRPSEHRRVGFVLNLVFVALITAMSLLVF